MLHKASWIALESYGALYGGILTFSLVIVLVLLLLAALHFIYTEINSLLPLRAPKNPCLDVSLNSSFLHLRG